MKKLQGVVSGILVLAAMLVYPAAARTQDKVLLVRKAKVGDVTRMSMQGTLAGNLAGQPASLEVKGVDTTTVTAVSSDGSLTLQQLAESLEMSINGLVMSGLPIPPADTIVMRSTRALTSYTSGDGDFETAAFERKMYNATTVVFSDKPVGVGDSWTRTVEADVNAGVASAQVESKVIAFEKVGNADTLKISMSYLEPAAGGMQCTGTFWIDRVTGEDVRGEIEFKNAAFPQIGAVSGQLKQERLPRKQAG